MSSAFRLATWNSRSRSWAGQDRVFGQRRSASPSFSYASAVPQAGQWVGITNSRSLPSRRSTTGPTISGITSPALRSTTVSPISTPLRLTSLRVVQRGHAHRRAGHLHRLHHPERRDPTGPADVDADVQQLGGDLLGRVLVGDRPARRPRRRAELVLHRPLVELDHHAVDLVLAGVPVLAEVGDVGPHLIQRRRQLAVRADRQAPALERVVRVGEPVGREARPAPPARG